MDVRPVRAGPDRTILTLVPESDDRTLRGQSAALVFSGRAWLGVSGCCRLLTKPSDLLPPQPYVIESDSGAGEKVE